MTKTQSSRSSAPRRKREILTSPFWVQDGLQHCLKHGPWQTWEKKLLGAVHKRAYQYMWHAVHYATEVRQAAWPELEPLLLSYVLECGVLLMPPERLELFRRYLEGCGTTAAAEAWIRRRAKAATGSLDHIVWYASAAKKGRWEDAEDDLLQSTEHMLEYANEVVRGRLPATLHNAMVLHTHDDYVQEYIGKYGL